MLKTCLVFLFIFYSFSSSVFGEVILAEEAQEMLDDHIKQSELLKVPLPTNNRIIKDYQRFLDYRKKTMTRFFNGDKADNFLNYSYINSSNDKDLNGKTINLSKEVCKKILTEFDVGAVPSQKQAAAFVKCEHYYANQAAVDIDDGIKLHRKLILDIASSKEDKWVYKHSNKKDANPSYYQLWGVLSPLIMFYTVNYDQFNYSNDEHYLINTYFKEKAMKDRLDLDGDQRPLLCPITDPMALDNKIHKTNNCGSVRLRFAAAELALAITMQDKDLWAKGLWDLDYALSMIEREGFFVPLSAKGCRALGYSWDTSKLFSMNVEMLKLADFNLLDYKTRHGKTIAEAYEVLLKQYADITISNYIAEKGVGSSSCGEKPYKTHEEFLYQELGYGSRTGITIDPDPAILVHARKYKLIPIDEDYINWSIRFVTEKHPDWVSDKNSLDEIVVHKWLGAYFSVQAFEIFNANIMSEPNGIWQNKKKQLELESQKEAAACKVSSLNVEYIAKWFFINVNDKQKKLEFQGSEPLTLDKCKGSFAGTDNFQPSNDLRKYLQVNFKTDGSITVSGELDLFEKGDARKIELKGNINSGKISGIWGSGDQIIIQLSKKPKVSKLDEKKNSSCEDNSNGEYIASWFAASTKDDVGWEFVGTEKITFDDCEGKFEAAEDFQPEDWFKMSKALRKDLNVYIKPDGSIVISGDLDLDYSETQRININGKISSGEVLGYFNTGWQLKVELKKK